MENEILRGAEQFDFSNYGRDSRDSRNELEVMLDRAILQADYLRQMRAA